MGRRELITALGTSYASLYERSMKIHKRITDKMAAGFPFGTFSRIDTARSLGETRTDFIRDAVERELKRRERLAGMRAQVNVSRSMEA